MSRSKASEVRRDDRKDIGNSGGSSRHTDGYQPNIHSYYSKAIMAATAATTAAIREAECWDTSKIGNSK